MDIIPKEQWLFVYAKYILMSHFVGNQRLAQDYDKRCRAEETFWERAAESMRNGNQRFIQALAGIRKMYRKTVLDAHIRDITESMDNEFMGIEPETARAYIDDLTKIAGDFGLLCDWAKEEIHRLVGLPFPQARAWSIGEVVVIARLDLSIPVHPDTKQKDVESEAIRQIKNKWPEYGALQRQQGYGVRDRPHKTIHRDIYWLYQHLAFQKTSGAIAEDFQDYKDSQIDYKYVDSRFTKWRKILRLESTRQRNK